MGVFLSPLFFCFVLLSSSSSVECSLALFFVYFFLDLWRSSLLLFLALLSFPFFFFFRDFFYFVSGFFPSLSSSLLFFLFHDFAGVLWVECLSSGLEFLQDLKVCMFVFCFQWGIQAWASKCFVCIFLFSALFVNRSAQKLKHMHVLSCSSFSVFLCGTVLHLKVEQSEDFFSVLFFVFGYAVRSLKTANT